MHNRCRRCVLSALEAGKHGDQVFARIFWTGVVASDVRPFTAGQVLTAHIAQFIRAEGDVIAEIETYDCYEPIA